MNKFANILYRILGLVLLILMCFIEYHCIYNIPGMTEALHPIVIIIGTIIFILVLIRIKKAISKLSKKTKRVLAISICVFSFIGMVIFGYCFKATPGNDLSYMINEKNIMQENGGKFETEEYFGVYPHQASITIFVYIFSQIGNFLGIKDFMIVVNAFLMSMTGYFIYLIISKIKQEDFAITTLLFYALNPIIYLYASYYYTDTISFLFAIVPIYLYICSLQVKNNKLKYLYLIATGIILTFGYKIRAVVVIILIGILIGEFLSHKELKEKLKISTTIIAGFALGMIASTLIVMPFHPIKNKNLEFPATFYIMIGTNINQHAAWNTEDYQYTQDAGNYSEKVEANIARIKENISKLGPSGLIDLLKLKLKKTWSNGGYDYETKLFTLEDTNYFYEYILGNKKILLTYILQICKVLLYLMFIFAIFCEIRRSSKMKFLFISIFGFLLFFIFWESLLRYSLSCMPWIMLAFPMGLEALEKILNKLTSNLKIKKLIKYFGILILCVSIVMLVLAFKSYCVTQSTYYDEVAMQQNPRRIIKNISNKVIEQEFVASREFNTIKLKFINESGLEKNTYNLEIINSIGEILVKQQFSSDSIENESFKTFSFDYILPNGEEKYIIKIYAENKNVEDSSIGIYKYESEQLKALDVYPIGKLKINGEVQNGQDLTFKVENVTLRSMFSKKVYILVSVFIILVEVYALYPYIKMSKIPKLEN